MSWRELECYTEGYTDLWHRLRETMAWMQTNLINVHVPRGKPRVLLEQILPKRKPRVRSEDAAPPDVVVEDAELIAVMGGGAEPVDAFALERRRRKLEIERREEASFWNSPEGRALQARLDDQDKELELREE